MPRELTIAEIAADMQTPQCPSHVKGFADTVGLSTMVNGRSIRHLRFGETMPAKVRKDAESYLVTLNSALDPMAALGTIPGPAAKVAVVTKLIMGLASANVSDDAMNARYDLYEIALADVPAWAVARAAMRWIKRDCPDGLERNPNFSFPPSPATLFAMAKIECGQLETWKRHITENVIEVVTHDEIEQMIKRDYQPALPGSDGGVRIGMRKM